MVQGPLFLQMKQMSGCGTENSPCTGLQRGPVLLGWCRDSGSAQRPSVLPRPSWDSGRQQLIRRRGMFFFLAARPRAVAICSKDPPGWCERSGRLERRLGL